MQKYELMAIIENSLDAKAAQKHAADNLDKRIESEFGGKVTFSDFWGERGFAYIINKQKWGYYHVCQFDMDPTQAQTLRHELNLDNSLVRFMIMKVDPKAPAPRKYADMKKEYEAQEKAKADEKKPAEEKPAPGKKEKLTTIKADEPKAEAKEEAPTKAEKPAEPETPKDDVDKKLDAIVDESAADL